MDVEKEIKLIIYQKQNITEVITHRHQLYDANKYLAESLALSGKCLAAFLVYLTS